MRNLVVCCDGTWNTPGETEHGLPSPTNVVKLYNALPHDDQQSAYYHPGVGTGKGWWDHVAGGGTGEGLDQNIMSAYHWLALRYAPDDRIFLFGVSRGAYTVRSLGGLIARCGLLDVSDRQMPPKDVWQRVGEVFAAYRQGVRFANPNGYPFHNTPAGDDPSHKIPIHFIGVWDTVGALGIPDDLTLLALFDNADRYRFHDTRLSPIVRHARHALALDEVRAGFAPTLWTGFDPQQIDAKQIWFPGVHCDVCGGYLETGLSDGALFWMLDEAEPCGLRLRPNVRNQLSPDPQGIAHNSYTGLFALLKSKPRSTPLIGPGTAGLHESVVKRHAEPPLAQGEYWPTIMLQPGEQRTVDVFARQHWNATGIFLEKGVPYDFIASGEWLDGATPFRPSGGELGGFHLGDIGRFASSLLGTAETAFRALTHGRQPSFWFTRRDENAAWFALVGFVASEDGLTDASAAVGETFVIGAGTRYTPKQSGYLYCFANDAWQTYQNNRGAVALTVSRPSN